MVDISPVDVVNTIAKHLPYAILNNLAAFLDIWESRQYRKQYERQYGASQSDMRELFNSAKKQHQQNRKRMHFNTQKEKDIFISSILASEKALAHFSDQERMQMVKNIAHSDEKCKAINTLDKAGLLNQSTAQAVAQNEDIAQAINILADRGLLNQTNMDKLVEPNRSLAIVRLNERDMLIQIGPRTITNPNDPNGRLARAINHLANTDELLTPYIVEQLTQDLERARAVNQLCEKTNQRGDKLLDQERLNLIIDPNDPSASFAHAVNNLAVNGMLTEENLQFLAEATLRAEALNRLDQAHRLTEQDLYLLSNPDKCQLIAAMPDELLTEDNINMIRHASDESIRELLEKAQNQSLSQSDINKVTPRASSQASSEELAFMTILDAYVRTHDAQLTDEAKKQLQDLKQLDKKAQANSIPNKLHQAGMLNDLNLRAIFRLYEQPKPDQPNEQNELYRSILHRQAIIRMLNDYQLEGQVNNLKQQLSNDANVGELRAVDHAFRAIETSMGIKDSNLTQEQKNKPIQRPSKQWNNYWIPRLCLLNAK